LLPYQMKKMRRVRILKQMEKLYWIVYWETSQELLADWESDVSEQMKSGKLYSSFDGNIYIQ
jgi:hypothetical protein